MAEKGDPDAPDAEEGDENGPSAGEAPGADARACLALMRASGVEPLIEADGGPVLAVLARQRDIDIRYPALDVHRLRLCLSGRLVGVQEIGEGEVPASGTAPYRALPGALHFVPAGSAARLRETGHGTCLHLLIDRGAMDEEAERLAADGGARPEPAPFAALLDETLHACLVPIRAELDATRRGASRRLELLGRAACTGILGRETADEPTRRRAETLSRDTLERALEALEDEVVAGEGLAAVARRVGLSPHHFSRAFRNATGTSPYRHVARRRVARAMAMLADSEVTLASVAKASGYSSQAHMTSAFRRHAGTTPARYRAAHR